LGAHRHLFVCLAAIVLGSSPAAAHPHVWATVRSEIVLGPDHKITGIRHAWTFDEFYTAMAIEGLDTNKDGVYSRQELQPLAQINVESLKDFDYFTLAKANGQAAAFAEPSSDYYVEFKDQLLTLYFTLPFKTPVKAKELAIEVYDPSYFVDFSFADKNPVKVVGAPPQCKVATSRAGETGVSSETPPADPSNWGAMYANRILVKCP
jgi:ABC-type uncharacterized transport system substrate-binding protein